MASFGRIAQLTRNFTTSTVARSQGWQQKGIPGSNMPFDISKPYKLTAIMIAFFGLAYTAPFLVVRLQMSKR